MHHNRRRLVLLLLLALSTTPAPAQAQPGGAFDHNYAAWDGLLRKHVHWLPDNKQSRVDYQGFAKSRDALQAVLASWSAVSPTQFAAFSRAQQMAFLINSYNGFTIELILTQYPNLKSIKELGGLLHSPWKKKFFRLLGEERYLDWIEHEQLRPRYNDWRVHVGVNCASIGCPALRPEAYTPAQLDAQLDDGMLRFMSDSSRNRYADGQVALSGIFKWFSEDFQKGDRGVRSLNDLILRYADALGIPAPNRQAIRNGEARIRYLDYDWSLNDANR
ncbi:MAG: DUF547 domain-containing protein [Burkholderiaceae bacterium]